jgi:hypothetical protein
MHHAADEQLHLLAHRGPEIIVEVGIDRRNRLGDLQGTYI